MLPGGGTGPQLGAQFAQLVKELRSEYAGAVTAAAARIAGALFAAPGRSILRILQQHGVTGTPSLMQQQARAAPAQATLPCPLLGRAQAAAACAGPLWGLCEGGGLVSGACVPSPGRQNSDREFRRTDKAGRGHGDLAGTAHRMRPVGRTRQALPSPAPPLRWR